MLRKYKPFASEDKSFSWWWLGIQVGVITALIIWWWLDRRKKKQPQFANSSGDQQKSQSILLFDGDPKTGRVPTTPRSTPIEPDDLRMIEGIGPKIQMTLQAAGIETFTQLAAAQPVDLKQILVEAGIRIGDPDTWPEQAAWAAKGDWDALTEFQSTLQGGRRVE